MAVTGFALYLRQTAALYKKNAILSYRGLVATLLQLASSFFFIFLIWCIDRAVTARYSSTTTFKNLANPEPTLIPAIPKCENGYFIKTPCYDFLWSGNESSTIVELVKNISIRNSGRPIDFGTKTLGFSSPSDVDAWLLANPYRTTGALHFSISGGSISFGVQTNSTARQVRGNYEDPTFAYQVPLQSAAEKEIARFLAQNESLEWTPSYTEFAHPAIETISVVGSVGPTFLFAAAMFGFVIQMSNLVLEREQKLRQVMSTMGLLDSAYWTSWLLWEVGLSIISSLLIVLFGMLFQFRFFLQPDFLVLFVLFFLFSLSMISCAYLLSTFIRKSSSANTTGFVVFIMGFVAQLLTQFGFPYDSSFTSTARSIWSLFPPNLLSIALLYIGESTATDTDYGIKWSGISSCTTQNPDCTLTLAGIYRWLLALFVVYFVIALYFDNVFPDSNGVRKPFFFFLSPGFWFGKGISSREGGGCCKCLGRIPALPPHQYAEDEDVAAEAERVQQSAPDPTVALSLRGLVKSFPGVSEFVSCCPCRCRKTPAFHAVQGTWLEVQPNTIFCLLGPNGAGKSTTINCLTGIVPTTSGDGLIYGHSIRNAADMNRIRGIMGVCPQFDILWDSLTGREHLNLFASIKGIPAVQLRAEVEGLLVQVNLKSADSVRAGSYSGGMKRRLSVAIALIGDPKVLFLDEPTTGMDPVTRRSVWDIIEAAKPGRAVVLTTHSMEEADILGDRIGIMAKGRLRCLGTSIHLKSKFGAGYRISVAVDGDSQAIKDFFLQRLGVTPEDENKAYTSFLVPRSAEKKLAPFFTELKMASSKLGVTDIQLSLTTLEEVFLNIARQAELETAAIEGRYETISLHGGLQLNVPIGAELVTVPGTASAEFPQGMIVEVQWQQDDSGTLRVASHSDLKPASGATLSEGDALLSSSGRGSSRRRGGPLVGHVVEMAQR